jgi:pimeloyl-ACP methyl ester carboxylesterase
MGASGTEREHRVRVDDGVRLLVLEHRAAQPHLRLPVVFLPGWVSHRTVWREFVARLACSATVFHVEGRDKDSAEIGSAPHPDMSIGRQAVDLACVVGDLGLGAGLFHLVGSSTGSAVILDYLICRRGPPRPAAAALMLPVGRFPIPAWAQPLLLLPHHVIAALKPAIKTYVRLALSDRRGPRTMLGYNFASIDRMEPRRTRLAARALLRYRLPAPGDLARVRVPTLVAEAGADRMHRSEVAAALSAGIASSQRVDVEESGRVHSAWMAELLLGFFARCEGAAATAAGASAGSPGPQSCRRAQSTPGCPAG